MQKLALFMNLMIYFALFYFQASSIPVVLAENSGRCNKNESDEKVWNLLHGTSLYHFHLVFYFDLAWLRSCVLFGDRFFQMGQPGFLSWSKQLLKSHWTKVSPSMLTRSWLKGLIRMREENYGFLWYLLSRWDFAFWGSALLPFILTVGVIIFSYLPLNSISLS